ncbi:MAG: peptide ABC transporter substrate-binding protein, partial [Oscillospiraceae bacterium]|nr:peptide ABC transporter substrate-binding protein [Oscillospiraceae bacterium]
MKKLLAILLSVVLLVSLFAACKKTPAANPTPAPGGDAPATSAPGGDSPASPAPAPGGDAAKPLDIIRVNVASEPMTIDPQLNSSVDGAIYSHHVFEGLYKWEDDGTGNAIIVPGQAESYDKVENADGT